MTEQIQQRPLTLRSASFASCFALEPVVVAVVAVEVVVPGMAGVPVRRLLWPESLLLLVLRQRWHQRGPVLLP